MSEYLEDTNGKWVRVKGTGVAHTGDVVPLDGIKGPGSANTYFDVYAYNKHVGVPVAPKAKPIVRIMFICGYPGMCMMLLAAGGIIPKVIGFLIGGLLTFTSCICLLVTFKMSCDEECKNAEKDNNDVREE